MTAINPIQEGCTATKDLNDHTDSTNADVLPNKYVTRHPNSVLLLCTLLVWAIGDLAEEHCSKQIMLSLMLCADLKSEEEDGRAERHIAQQQAKRWFATADNRVVLMGHSLQLWPSIDTAGSFACTTSCATFHQQAQGRLMCKC